MMTYWIALFFQATSLLNSPTTYIDVIQASASLNVDHNVYAVFQDTGNAGNYMLSLSSPSIFSIFPNLAHRRVFQGVEQTVLRGDLGRVSLIATKFLAKPQWIILTVEDGSEATYGIIGSTNHPANTMMEHFAMSIDSVSLADFAMSKALDTGLSYKIYRAQEYDAKDSLNFSFTPK